jgi:hypothetical protein
MKSVETYASTDLEASNFSKSVSSGESVVIDVIPFMSHRVRRGCCVPSRYLRFNQQHLVDCSVRFEFSSTFSITSRT